jgi:hypothetical protein
MDTSRMRLSHHTQARLWQILLIAGLVYAVGMVVYPPLRLLSGSSDFLAFHRTARHFLETGRITTDYGVQNYLPFFVILMIPFALLPAWLACGLFNALSIALLVLCLIIIDTWLLPPHRAGPWARIVLPTLLVLPFITAGLILGQVILLVLFLVTFGWALFEQRRSVPAGLCLSLAALIKAFPAILLLFFLVKRRWAVLAGAALGLAGFGLGGSLAVLGPQKTWNLHKDYFNRVVLGRSALTTIEAAKARELRYNNQSLAAVIRRLLRPTDAAPRPPHLYVNVANLSPALAQAVYLVLAATGLVAAMLLAHNAVDQIPLQRLRFEFALFLLLSLILSPLLWVCYLSLALYPLCLLTFRLMADGDARRPNRLGLIVWLAWIAALPFLASHTGRALGIHMWATVLLALAVAREALRTEPPAPQPA